MVEKDVPYTRPDRGRGWTEAPGWGLLEPPGCPLLPEALVWPASVPAFPSPRTAWAVTCSLARPPQRPFHLRDPEPSPGTGGSPWVSPRHTAPSSFLQVTGSGFMLRKVGRTHGSHLIFGETHSSVSVTEEGDERGSWRALLVIVGCAVPVGQLDHPVVIRKLSIAASQVPYKS